MPVIFKVHLVGCYILNGSSVCLVSVSHSSLILQYRSNLTQTNTSFLFWSLCKYGLCCSSWQTVPICTSMRHAFFRKYASCSRNSSHKRKRHPKIWAKLYNSPAKWNFTLNIYIYFFTKLCQIFQMTHTKNLFGLTLRGTSWRLMCLM